MPVSLIPGVHCRRFVVEMLNTASVLFNQRNSSMKHTAMLLLALLLFTPRSTAGEVYGTISQGEKPVAAGVKVEIAVSGKVYTGETDKFGSYRIIVKEKGKCTVTVRLNDETATAAAFSYDKATRYDWILQTTSGKLSLQRK